MSTALKLNQKILSYTLKEQFGEGELGSVYRAVNETLGQEVAIKIMNPLLSRNPELRERFLKEARIQIAMRHQGIIQPLTAGVDGELLCLVHEYMNGHPLDQVIAKRGGLPSDEALKIFNQVLAAVGYVHERGVLHRGIKSSNIIVQADGTLKVMDFGIAKVLGDVTFTRIGTAMGSVSYMSPEQVLGHKDLDQSTSLLVSGQAAGQLHTGSLTLTSAKASKVTKMVRGALASLLIIGAIAGCTKFSFRSSKLLDLSRASNVELQKLADDGDPLAQYELGMRFLYGTMGFKIDLVNSEKWLKSAREAYSESEDKDYGMRSCYEEVVFVCQAIGYFEHEAGKKNVAKGMWAKACEEGMMRGCFDLGKLEFKLNNYAEAKRFYGKACEGGVMMGCYELGLLEQHDKSHTEAKRYHSKACEGGVMKGCFSLGFLHLSYGGDADKFFLKACEGGHLEGCTILGSMLVIRGNKAEAKRLYGKACEEGSMRGCRELGDLEEKADNRAEAEKHWAKACAGGYREVCKAKKK